MSKSSLQSKIEELFRNEQDTASKFPEMDLPVNRTSSPSFDDMISGARTMLKLNAVGDLDERFENWGHWAQMPLPTIIAIQGQVIVDLFSISPDHFPAVYGVSLSQFKRLCRERMIILNVFEDGDITKELNEGRTLTKSRYLQFPEFEALFDQDDFGTRVMGVRRVKMLESIGLTKDRQDEYLEKYLRLLLPQIKMHPLNRLNALLAGSMSTSHRGATLVVANNLLYIGLLGTGRDKQRLYRLEQITNYSEVEKEWPILELVKWTRGRKADLASPITAAYGGTYNSTEVEVALREKYRPVAGSSTYEKTGRSITPELAALAEFQTRASQITIDGLKDVDVGPFEIWNEPNKFENFISFIKEKRQILSDIDETIWRNKHLGVADDGTYDFSNWETYLKLTRDIYQDASPNSGIKEILICAAAGSALAKVVDERATSIVQHYVMGSMSAHPKTTRRSFLRMAAGYGGVAVGGALGGLTGTAMAEISSEEFTEPERSARRLIVNRVRQLTDLYAPEYLYR